MRRHPRHPVRHACLARDRAASRTSASYSGGTRLCPRPDAGLGRTGRALKVAAITPLWTILAGRLYGGTVAAGDATREDAVGECRRKATQPGHPLSLPLVDL